MSRKPHTYHFIYKTTCLITGRYYIGMHSTSKLNDGYLGSGKKLWHSINYYGKDNHSIQILEFLPDRKSLSAKESEIVNEDLLCDPMCMNLVPGGEGWNGFFSKEHQLKCSAAGGQRTAALISENQEYSEAHSLKMSIANKKAYLNGKQVKAPDWTGKTHRPETKLKIGEANSARQRGTGNSQFGTRWMHRPGEKPIKVESSRVAEHSALGYLLGRGRVR